MCLPVPRMRRALPPERTLTSPDNSLHFHPFQGFLVLNYWLHGYQMPKGVRSQLSYEAGIGSRRWVDAKQPPLFKYRHFSPPIPALL